MVIVFQFGGGAESLTLLSTVFEILIWGILLFRHFGRQSLVIGDSKIGNYQFSFFKTSTAAEQDLPREARSLQSETAVIFKEIKI